MNSPEIPGAVRILKGEVMALETLKGVKEIGGFAVHRVEWNHEHNNPIEVNDKHNAITFKIQNGPIKEVGVNGCQVDTLIETAQIILMKLDEKLPCFETKGAIRGLETALEWLAYRKFNREKRGVEGTSQA